MDYEKIGDFISKLRKEKKLTQKELADLLHITDKAVSKWERGLGCPDVSLLGELSEILDVGIGELLNGEENDTLKDNNDFIVNAVNYSKNVSENKIYKNIYNVLIIIASILCIYLITTSIYQIKDLNSYEIYSFDNDYVNNIKKEYVKVKEKSLNLYDLDSTKFKDYDLTLLKILANKLQEEPKILKYNGEQKLLKYQCNMDYYEIYNSQILLLQIANLYNYVDPFMSKIIETSTYMNMQDMGELTQMDNILLCDNIYSEKDNLSIREKLDYLMLNLTEIDYVLDIVLEAGGINE